MLEFKKSPASKKEATTSLTGDQMAYLMANHICWAHVYD